MQVVAPKDGLGPCEQLQPRTRVQDGLEADHGAYHGVVVVVDEVLALGQVLARPVDDVVLVRVRVRVGVGVSGVTVRVGARVMVGARVRVRARVRVSSQGKGWGQR